MLQDVVFTDVSAFKGWTASFLCIQEIYLKNANVTLEVKVNLI